jgi:hypothetical protein
VAIRAPIIVFIIRIEHLLLKWILKHQVTTVFLVEDMAVYHNCVWTGLAKVLEEL